MGWCDPLCLTAALRGNPLMEQESLSTDGQLPVPPALHAQKIDRNFARIPPALLRL